VVLGEGLDAERISADYRDGVLIVTIPMVEQAKPRKIAISRSASHEGHKMITGEFREGGGETATQSSGEPVGADT
jgi:HSP20 family protein